MNKRVDFETPENIQISYQIAGVGTRFLAWFVDNIFLTIVCILLFFALIATAIASNSVIRDLIDTMGGPEDFANEQQVGMVFIGLWLLVWSLGSFFYFGLSELLMRGQSIGKRMSKIRVVKTDGFALDPTSILIRSIFRVVDQLPPLWIVPVLSARSQRLGDMVGGTIVVADRAEEISSLRELLGNRTAADSRYRFTAAMLERSRPVDFATIESILERWQQLSPEERDALTDKIVPALVTRLETELPDRDDHYLFLEDLLAAEFRRQSRKLG